MTPWEGGTRCSESPVNVLFFSLQHLAESSFGKAETDQSNVHDG